MHLLKRGMTNMFAVFVAVCVMGIATAQGTVLSKYKEWLLPSVPQPEENHVNEQRAHLGKMLFFDARLSGTGEMSCATCHDPNKGWSDGLPTAVGKDGKVLGRATPSIVNTAYQEIMMWDGRKVSLEDQASGPLDSADEMDMNMVILVENLKTINGYKQAFSRAYPNEAINKDTVTKAIAAFERTLVCNDSPFDRWAQGDQDAMTSAQVRGFKVFMDEERGNCATCHQPPNFTDDGFHNVGLKSYGKKNPDLGRYAQKKIKLMKGAFKTPSLRNIGFTAPYFHDGAAKTLEEVIEHYNKGGEVKTNLSPDIKELDLSNHQTRDLIKFLHALSCDTKVVAVPDLPN